jgi:hypothetical protein
MSKPTKKMGTYPAEWLRNWRDDMAKNQQCDQQRVDDVRIGDVIFYNGTISKMYGRELVTFYIGSDAVLRHEGGIIENCHRTVMLDKASWDSIVEALRTRKAA